MLHTLINTKAPITAGNRSFGSQEGSLRAEKNSTTVFNQATGAAEYKKEFLFAMKCCNNKPSCFFGFDGG